MQSDHELPEEHEIKPQTTLIFCEKKQKIPGFSQITLSPEISGENPEQTRQKIVNQLESEEGLTVQFQKGDIIKTLTFKNFPKADYLARVVALDKDDDRVHYIFIAGSQSIRKGKGNAKQISQYKSLGVSQIALSLGIEIIKFTNPEIQTIQGSIKRANTPSILSRLHSPNLTERNYFNHKITDSSIDDKITISTFLHQPSTIEQIKKIDRYPKPKQ